MKDLAVERNGRADVRGTVLGNVVIRGGDVRIDVTVYGSVVEQSGQTLIGPRTTIGGKRANASDP